MKHPYSFLLPGIILLLFSCRADESLERIYPSRAAYTGNGEITLLTDENNRAVIMADRIITLRVVGEEDIPHRIIIRFRMVNDAMQIIGYDPKGIYAPFTFFGTPEELFGLSPDDSIEADIQMVTVISQSTYELENLTFCRVGD